MLGISTLKASLTASKMRDSRELVYQTPRVQDITREVMILASYCELFKPYDDFLYLLFAVDATAHSRYTAKDCGVQYDHQ